VGTTRKLKEIGQDMESMTNQNNLVDFLDDPGNAQWVNGLVEDIRYAMMDYQVCAFKVLLSSVLISVLDFITTGHL